MHLTKKKIAPFQQGEFDALCGVYSIVNAAKIINDNTEKQSTRLFNRIIHFLSDKKSLAQVLIDGLLSKDIRPILELNKVQAHIPYYKIQFAHKTPDLETFWSTMQKFLKNDPTNPQKKYRAILLGIGGDYDHFAIVYRITETQLYLLDSSRITEFKVLNRRKCAVIKDTNEYILHPAQTYFLSRTPFDDEL